MTQSEGIAFLEDVRYYLIQMQQRYGNAAGALEAAVSSAESSEHRMAQDKLKYNVKEDNEDVDDLKMVAADASSVAATMATPKNRQSIVKPESTERAKPQGEIVVTSFGTAKSKSIIDPLVDEVGSCVSLLVESAAHEWIHRDQLHPTGDWEISMTSYLSGGLGHEFSMEKSLIGICI